MYRSLIPRCRLLVFLLLIYSCPACNDRPQLVKSTGENGETVYQSGDARRTDLQLKDGTKLLMDSASVIRIPAGFDSLNRDLFLEGAAFFSVSSRTGRPFVVHTRAFVITVHSPVAEFKVDGYPGSPGEEVDLLSGILKVAKSYHSDTDANPEMLFAGEMVMINTDIDLMEKEKFDTTELKTWIGVKRNKK